MHSQILDPIYTRHAGLVIVVPFLAMLFSRLELTQDHQFVDAASQQRAVQLLGYVASGTDETPEYELVLHKILCGMPLLEPLVIEKPLTTVEMNLADEMLEVIIQNWAALGTTSIKGLRESFLMRDGMLEEKDSNFNLKVEHRGYDILLDRLPWTINSIKLTWMHKQLETTWR